jgi:hypothetical protein
MVATTAIRARTILVSVRVAFTSRNLATTTISARMTRVKTVNANSCPRIVTMAKVAPSIRARMASANTLERIAMMATRARMTRVMVALVNTTTTAIRVATGARAAADRVNPAGAAVEAPLLVRAPLDAKIAAVSLAIWVRNAFPMGAAIPKVDVRAFGNIAGVNVARPARHASRVYAASSRNGCAVASSAAIGGTIRRVR